MLDPSSSEESDQERGPAGAEEETSCSEGKHSFPGSVDQRSLSAISFGSAETNANAAMSSYSTGSGNFSAYQERGVAPISSGPSGAVVSGSSMAHLIHRAGGSIRGDPRDARPASPSPSQASERETEQERAEREEEIRRKRLQLYVFVLRCIAYPFNAKQPTDMVKRQLKMNKQQLQSTKERFQSFLRGELGIASDEAFTNAVQSYYESFLKSDRVSAMVKGGFCSANDFRDIFKVSKVNVPLLKDFFFSLQVF